MLNLEGLLFAAIGVSFLFQAIKEQTSAVLSARILATKKLTRKRQSMAKKLAEEDVTSEEISQKIGSDIKVIKKWIGK